MRNPPDRKARRSQPMEPLETSNVRLAVNTPAIGASARFNRLVAQFPSPDELRAQSGALGNERQSVFSANHRE
jgi:hypothetical protein